MKDCIKLEHQSKTHPLQENIQTIQRLRNIVIFGEILMTSLTLGRWLALISIETTLTKLRSIQIPVRAKDRGLLWDKHRRLCLYCRTRTLERSGHADHWQLWTQPGTSALQSMEISCMLLYLLPFYTLLFSQKPKWECGVCWQHLSLCPTTSAHSGSTFRLNCQV